MKNTAFAILGALAMSVGADAQEGAPAINGAWVGTWGAVNAPKEKRMTLDCKAALVKPGTWEAVFWGDCGRPYKYEIKMLGRQSGSAVLFKGTVDLGEKDGGVYDWIGKATEGKFVGFYTSRKYVGTFELKRAPAEK